MDFNFYYINSKDLAAALLIGLLTFNGTGKIQTQFSPQSPYSDVAGGKPAWMWWSASAVP